MGFANDNRPIYVRLGSAWKQCEPFAELDLSVLPRIGEAFEFLIGTEAPRTLRVLDVKHSVIEDLQMTEVLVWPEDMLER